jgi:hypothetical protein
MRKLVKTDWVNGCSRKVCAALRMGMRARSVDGIAECISSGGASEKTGRIEEV